MNNGENTELEVIGKIAEAIPDSAWNRGVETACKLVTELLSPITASTSGLVRIITSTFDGLVDYQKICVGDILQRTRARLAAKSGVTLKEPKAEIVIAVLEQGSRVTDPKLRQLWASLFASELIDGGVHPALTRALAQITAGEAELLTKLMKVCIEKGHRPREKPPLIWLRKGGLGEHIQYEVLETAGLIDINLGSWMMNKMGWALMRAVGEYPLESKSPDGLSS